MTPFTTHLTRGLSRLIQKFKNKPNVTGFASALLMEVQELSDAIYEAWNYRLIDNAFGRTLDLWGVVLGRARGSLSDDSYRIRLKVQLLLLRSSGTVPELIQMFQLLAPSPRTVKYISRWNAAQEVAILGAASPEGADFAEILQSAKAAGVKSTLHWLEAAPADSFTTLGGGGKGWTSLASSAGTGGILSRAVG